MEIEGLHFLKIEDLQFLKMEEWQLLAILKVSSIIIMIIISYSLGIYMGKKLYQNKPSKKKGKKFWK